LCSIREKLISVGGRKGGKYVSQSRAENVFLKSRKRKRPQPPDFLIAFKKRQPRIRCKQGKKHGGLEVLSMAQKLDIGCLSPIKRSRPGNS